MRTAVRAEENPALDAARAAAAARGAPLMVAAFLLTAHPYPTARRWHFWLEGLRDARRELRKQVGADPKSCMLPGSLMGVRMGADVYGKKGPGNEDNEQNN